MDNDISEFTEYLQNLRIENSRNLLTGHMKINSIRSKVDMLSYMIGNRTDILMISESNLDGTFPTAQFAIDSFTALLG